MEEGEFGILLTRLKSDLNYDNDSDNNSVNIFGCFKYLPKFLLYLKG